MFGIQVDFAKHIGAIPNGFYKKTYRVYDDYDDNIFTFKHVLEIDKSDLRDWK